MSYDSIARVQDAIADLVAGQRVLDLGCVQHDAARAADDTWLHAHLVRRAASVIGVDRLADQVAALQARGYQAVVGDACHLDLGQQFDVVVAGEIIEHVDEPGPFLDGIRAHLAPGGRLILTTPYAHSAYYVLEAWWCDPARRWNPAHVAWYEPFTLGNLLARHGFRMTACRCRRRAHVARARPENALPPSPNWRAGPHSRVWGSRQPSSRRSGSRPERPVVSDLEHLQLVQVRAVPELGDAIATPR